MVCNRDELRTRPSALPPRLVESGTRRSAMPIDAEAGGTWVAVNDAGVAATLLNLNLPDAKPVDRAESRGQIIPPLMACGSAAEAAEAAGNLLPTQYKPFRLVLADPSMVYLIRSDGHALSVKQIGSPGSGPMLFTSSGLGDHLVEGPRRELFEQLFAGPPETWLRVQSNFHRHRWQDQLPLSVLMSRDDAATVSISSVDIDERIALQYWSNPTLFDSPADAESISLTEVA